MANTPSLVKYLPRILAYPLTGYALGTVLLLSAMLWLGLQSVFGIALLAVAAPWVFHYAEAVIIQSASGRATPPRFGGDMLFLGSNIKAFRPLLGVAAIAAGWVHADGAGTRFAVLAVGAFLFPAYMLAGALSDSLLQALNPLRIIGVVFGLGRAYFAVFAVLTAAAGAVVVLGQTSIFSEVLMASGHLTLFIALVLSIYLWLMAFHLLGYVAYHRADKLGLSLKNPPPTEASRALDAQQERLESVLRNVDASLSNRDLVGAARALAAPPDSLYAPRLFHEELFVQMRRRKQVELIHLQGQALITILLAEKRVTQAVDVAESCFDAHPDFITEKPAQAVVLAEEALKTKRDRLCEWLAAAVERHHGGTEEAITMKFLAARYWAERKGDEARAGELMRPLMKHTSHPRHRQISAYAKVMRLV